LVRIEQLETINGWTWDLLETDFQQGITELKNYISKYKNARVSYDYVNERHYKLGQWVSERRKQFKKDKLSKERIQYLESFEGWVWDANKKF